MSIWPSRFALAREPGDKATNTHCYNTTVLCSIRRLYRSVFSFFLLQPFRLLPQSWSVVPQYRTRNTNNHCNTAQYRACPAIPQLLQQVRRKKWKSTTSDGTCEVDSSLCTGREFPICTQCVELYTLGDYDNADWDEEYPDIWDQPEKLVLGRPAEE